MFRKSFAAATTALVAAVLTFGAVAAPAYAGDGSDATSTTTPTGAPQAGTPPAVVKDAVAAVSVSAPGCDTGATLTLKPPTNATWGTPSRTTGPGTYTVTATATDGHAFADGSTTKTFSDVLAGPVSCPPTPPTTTTTNQSLLQHPSEPLALECLPSSAVSYTYEWRTNSGVITVSNPDPTRYTNTLCRGFYVTAAGWQFTGATFWPQSLVGYAEANGGQMISQVGEYPYGYPVTCGQGDIYASFSPVKTPPATLLSPSNPYPEYFLQDMPFTGPYPTSMWTSETGGPCHVINVDKVDPQVTSITKCGMHGSISWTDDPAKVTYALTKGDGTSGANEVTATAVAPWVFPDGSTTHVFTIDLGTYTDCDATPGDPSVTPSVCVDGTQGNGTIVVDFRPGVLAYTLTYPDGTVVPVKAATTQVPAGTYIVGVSAEPGYQLAGASNWPLKVVVDAPTDCGQLPTHAVLPTSVGSTGASCSTGLGSITVGPDAALLEFIDYSIDGVRVTQPTTTVKPGVHTVTAAVDKTTAPDDTLDNAGPWTVTIAPPPDGCGQLKTLALTGVSPAPGLMAAGVLLPLGAALLIGAAMIRRRRAS